MIISINGREFPPSTKSETRLTTGLKTKESAGGALIVKKIFEKYETEHEYEGMISIADQKAFYNLAYLGMTEPLTIVARDNATDEIVTYQGMTTDDPKAPKIEYIGSEGRIYSGVAATFREV